MIATLKNDDSRICQGDIFTDIVFFKNYSVNNEIIEITTINFPYAIVLTQDCDLESDKRVKQPGATSFKDKILMSVLLAPLYISEHFFYGQHLTTLGFEANSYDKDKSAIRSIKNNTNPRYHFLDFGNESILPNLVCDFKHYFSSTVQYLETNHKEKYVLSLGPLFREDILDRFAAYLSRIGLPVL